MEKLDVSSMLPAENSHRGRKGVQLAESSSCLEPLLTRESGKHGFLFAGIQPLQGRKGSRRKRGGRRVVSNTVARLMPTLPLLVNTRKQACENNSHLWSGHSKSLY